MRTQDLPFYVSLWFFWKRRINYFTQHVGLSRTYLWFTICFSLFLAAMANNIIYILLAFAVCCDLRFKITSACFQYEIIMFSLLLGILFCFIHLIHTFIRHVKCIICKKKGHASEFWSKSDYLCNLIIYLGFTRVDNYSFVKAKFLYKFYG